MGHGSLTAGIIASAGLAAGTAALVCGVFVRMKVSAELDRVYENLFLVNSELIDCPNTFVDCSKKP